MAAVRGRREGGRVGARPARLLVAAPGRLGPPVVAAFAARGVAARARLLPEPRGRGADPYDLEGMLRAEDRRPEGLVVVVPRRRGPRGLAPGPVVGGVPVGIVPAGGAADVGPWLAAVAEAPGPDGAWGALAMGQDRYLELSGRMLGWMRDARADGGAADWSAAAISRRELCARLAAGPRLVVYVGHGRAAGWSGYQALRWRHVEAEAPFRPCGSVVAFACDTLTRPRGTPAFGARWIDAGRAQAYLGAAAPIRTDEATRLAEAFGALLATGRHATLGGLLRELDAELSRSAALAGARRAFRAFRLMGDPLARLAPAPASR